MSKLDNEKIWTLIGWAGTAASGIALGHLAATYKYAEVGTVSNLAGNPEDPNKPFLFVRYMRSALRDTAEMLKKVF